MGVGINTMIRLAKTTPPHALQQARNQSHELLVCAGRRGHHAHTQGGQHFSPPDARTRVGKSKANRCTSGSKPAILAAAPAFPSLL